MRSKRKFNYALNSRTLGLNVLLLVVLIYFIFHALSGSRGLMAYFKYNRQIEDKQKILEGLQEERAKLQEEIKLLHPDSMSLDYLEELAKKELGMIGEDEVVIFMKKETR